MYIKPNDLPIPVNSQTSNSTHSIDCFGAFREFRTPPSSSKNLENVDSINDAGLDYSNIGGLNSQIRQIKEMIELPLLKPELFTKYGLSPPRGVLLYGPPGTGKTMLAKAVAYQTKANVIIINGSEIATKYFGESETKLTNLFNKARKNSPSIIFIDEIDALCPKRSSLNTSATESRIVTTMLTLMDGFSSTYHHGNEGLDTLPDRVVVIGATNRPNSLDEALRRPGRFDREIEIPVPSSSDRLEIMSVILKKVPNSLTDKQIASITEKLHGFVGADIMALCREAGLLAIKRCFKTSLSKFMSSERKIDYVEHVSRPDKSTEKLASIVLDELHKDSKDDKVSKLKNSDVEPIIKKPTPTEEVFLTFEDCVTASQLIKPSGMREIMLEVPKVYWSDIGGQGEVKARLKEAIQLPLENPSLFTSMGINPPKGVLLYGPPGCSKTLFAKALATESGLNFIAVKGPELFNKYVGESEKAVRNVFKRARQNSPSIIFFDEIDSLTTSRSSGNSGGSVSERVLAQLLTELDGIDQLCRVSVVAATNRPDIIDPALLRPGRFDRILYVPPPDFDSRCAIFDIQLKKMQVNSKDVTPNVLAEMTEGFSGAEVVSFCQEAAISAMEDDVNTKVVELKHFKQVRSGFKMHITKEMIQFYTNYQSKRKKLSI
ncbi:Spermatogenesis-associated protein 5 [Smittium mucronatum]|uniref:Spermatogenesis-associated protein 5 n=1 Tax=Smittium mucronatum TaxID=133383 RepID=A0A1R0GSE2_9FUNG|nr:Spermatogenesis-associated protein 5 [Smittium mucronatum]